MIQNQKHFILREVDFSRKGHLYIYISTAGYNSKEDDVSVQIILTREDAARIAQMKNKPKIIEDQEVLDKFSNDMIDFAIKWGLDESYVMKEEL